MFTKLNQYLLTHYPLLWNTRIIQLLIVNALVHFFFFLGGYTNVSAAKLQDLYYGSSGSLITFSVLCSIAVLVLWLVFYLRNNALKSFYQLGKWHLVKEFGLILMVIATSITYFESYNYGERVKARSITPYAQMVQEVNTINLAKAFIPMDKENYFILNPCEDGNNNIIGVSAYSDTTVSYGSETSNTTAIKQALRLPNAFSYLNYCQVFISLDDTTSYHRNRKINSTVRHWVLGNKRDSIATVLSQCLAICKKYDINYMLDTLSLTSLPFIDSNHAITTLIKNNSYSDVNRPTPYYLSIYSLGRVFEFLDACHGLGEWKRNNDLDKLLAELYLILGLSILLLCYRRFSKKVFLISTIGSAVWCILIGLAGAASGDGTGPAGIFLFLFIIFTIVPLTTLRAKSSKTLTGILFSWHIYMLPALLMVMAMLMEMHYSNYENRQYMLYNSELHCQQYPISCWVHRNIAIIAWGNFVFSLLYITFVFNRLTKKWQTMPDE